jgi:Calcineurin-like phosphoesterase
MNMNRYDDVIGDIHGHAKALRNLLGDMGYHEDGGVFRHPDRRVIFVGDFIDRGPEQIDVLNISRSMCEAGTALAVMGNHEFNALGWATPDGNGGFLRPHNSQHHGQHKEFLLQIGDESENHISALAWFQTLPVWLDLPGLRIVHACWHGPSQQKLLPHLDEGQGLRSMDFAKRVRKGLTPTMPLRYFSRVLKQFFPMGDHSRISRAMCATK